MIQIFPWRCDANLDCRVKPGNDDVEGVRYGAVTVNFAIASST